MSEKSRLARKLKQIVLRQTVGSRTGKLRQGPAGICSQVLSVSRTPSVAVWSNGGRRAGSQNVASMTFRLASDAGSVYLGGHSDRCHCPKGYEEDKPSLNSPPSHLSPYYYFFFK